jgi:uncharacterized membrane protein YfcA
MLHLLIDKVTFPVSGVHTYWWLPGLVAFGISFFTSMGGLSGAFLLLPFQVSVLGFSSPAVSPTNLIYNVFAIPGGVYRYIRDDRMLWSLAMVTIAGTLPGIIIGALIRVYLFTNPQTFRLFVGLVLLYIGARLALTVIKKARGKGAPENFKIDPKKLTIRKIEFQFDGGDFSAPTPMIFLLAAAVGIIGGAYGIGGGAIIAPFIVAVFGFPVYTVAGAALLGTLVTSVAGVVIYQFLMPAISPAQIAINPDWLLGLSMGVGGLIGIYLGARLQRYFPDKFIKIILVISIGVVVVRYIGGYFFKL